MLEKIIQLKKEQEKLERDLQSPQILVSPEKLENISRKYNENKEIIGQWEKLKKIENSLKEIKEILDKEKDEELQIIAKEELEGLEKQEKEIQSNIQELLSPIDALGKRNIIMEIRAGVGGDEAELFSAELFRMYSKYAERKGWQTHLLNSSRTEIGGIKEVIFEINGQNVYKNLKYESGVHRVQRIPETEKSGRIHTSTATVAVLPQAEEIDIKIEPKDIRIDTFCSSGPGGQSVNTTYSAIRITHLSTGLVVSCQDEKSQLKNKAKALKVLRSRLLVMEEEKKSKEMSEKRKEQIGSAMRAEKIRTYNFPQDRITDHRIKKSWHSITNILNGDLDKIISDLKENLGKK